MSDRPRLPDMRTRYCEVGIRLPREQARPPANTLGFCFPSLLTSSSKACATGAKVFLGMKRGQGFLFLRSCLLLFVYGTMVSDFFGCCQHPFFTVVCRYCSWVIYYNYASVRDARTRTVVHHPRVGTRLHSRGVVWVVYNAGVRRGKWADKVE